MPVPEWELAYQTSDLLKRLKGAYLNLNREMSKELYFLLTAKISLDFKE
jgi:hypothetical protein